MTSLFDKKEDSRTEKQNQLVQEWVNNKLKGTIVSPTGFGKTRVGILAITRFLNKNKNRNVIIVVPSDAIKQQWIEELASWDLLENCSVKTMYDTSRNSYNCDLLVIDEIHKCLSNHLFKLFTNIKYKVILGLTATFERLDNRHLLLEKYCPIIAEVTIEEAVKNKWLSKYKEYLVLIEPDDYEVYTKLDKEFNEHFSFFSYDFNLAMSCVTSWKVRANLAKERCHGDDFKDVNKQILIHAMGFNRTLQARKKYINNHPKKVELAELIIEHRLDKKCITFSNTIAMAESIKYGMVYSGKDSAKKGRITLAEFIEQPTGILNTVMKVREGLNCPDLSVAINLGINSSKATNIQKRGRVIRTNDTDKVAEIFYLVLKNTVEVKWFQNAIGSSNYETIDEEALKNVLESKDYSVKKNKQTTLTFRF